MTKGETGLGTGAGTTAVCTVISKNYLHFARALMESVARVHPEWDRYVLLVDTLNGEFDPAKEPFHVVEIDEIGLPDPQQFLFRYTILEMNTAAKPWLLSWLFRNRPVQYVVYLDPDIQVYSPLAEAIRLLEEGALMVLTPHLTQELDEACAPSEHYILKAGCYNLGFLAVGRCALTFSFLSWWQRKLEHQCRNAPEENLFVDQRWMDLVPGLFDGVRILRDEAYNVAYWNLNHREITGSSDAYRVNDRPLVFLHFSGFDPLYPDRLSKHQNPLQLMIKSALSEILHSYARTLIRLGMAEATPWPYAFGALSDGTPILDVHRSIYQEDPAAEKLAGKDPFAHDHSYLNAPWGGTTVPLVTRLMRQIWSRNRDLQLQFPDIDGTSRHAYAQAFVGNLAVKEKVPERYIEPVRRSLSGNPAPPKLGWSTKLSMIGIRFLARAYIALMPMFIIQRSSRLLPNPLLNYWRWVHSNFAIDMKDETHRLWFHRKQRGLGPLDRAISTFSAGFRRTVVPASSADSTNLSLAEHHHLGLNIIGYFHDQHGIGESARLCVQAARAVGLPLSLASILEASTGPVTVPESGPLSFPINLFHVNADQTSRVLAAYDASRPASQYNIGIWHWELAEFPDTWIAASEQLDEIWVPTIFVLEAVSAKVRCPVLRVPHAIKFVVTVASNRAAWDLPADGFLFVTAFDARSYVERKNPYGVITAYRKAFPEPTGAFLVVKVSGADQVSGISDQLAKAMGGRKDIRIIDRDCSREEMYGLLSVADAFVSLHRSEGFGLMLAESMYLGKPVIATGWSGNRDFMTQENSLPVDYELQTLQQDHGPYRKGQVWAAPDLDQTALFMKTLVANPDQGRLVGAKGSATIRQQYSPERIGELYRQRVTWLQRSGRLHLARNAIRSE